MKKLLVVAMILVATNAVALDIEHWSSPPVPRSSDLNTSGVVTSREDFEKLLSRWILKVGEFEPTDIDELVTKRNLRTNTWTTTIIRNKTFGALAYCVNRNNRGEIMYGLSFGCASRAKAINRADSRLFIISGHNCLRKPGLIVRASE